MPLTDDDRQRRPDGPLSPEKARSIYLLTFVVAVTIDWSIPHLMPGNPVLTLMGRIQIQDPKVAQHVYDNYMRSFNLDLPLWKQYYYFWVSLLHGDLGTSILQFPVARVVDHHARDPVHARAARPGDPAQLVGRATSSERSPRAGRCSTTRCCRSGTCSPRRRTCGSRSCSSWVFAITLELLPVGLAYSPTSGRGWSVAFALDLAHHWVLPFLSLFLVGVRRLGDRDAEHDHLRARVRLRALPRGARRAAAARAQVRVPQRAAAADQRARARRSAQ